jgi:hypothetical protein
MTDDALDFSEDSDDSIIISGFKDKSLNRINIMTMNESFKKSDTNTSVANGNKSLQNTQEKISLDSKSARSPILNDKENVNNANIRNEQAYDNDVYYKRNDISDYSSRNKSNMVYRDESSSFLGISDEMITIEDTYKESDKREFENQSNQFLPSTYLINHLEMNVIEEQVDEEDKSCSSSMRRSNNMSGYNSNDPYYITSNVSREHRKQKDSFETFGHKSLAGAMHTIKSESRISKQGDHSYDSQKYESLEIDEYEIPRIEQSMENIKEEEEKTHPTDKKIARPLEMDDSTDISAQITKRTNNTKNSAYNDNSRTVNVSMPVLNFENLSKIPNDTCKSKEFQNSMSSTDGDRQSRIMIQEYGHPESLLKLNLNQNRSIESIMIVNNSMPNSQIEMIAQKRSLESMHKRGQAKDIQPETENGLGISSILEHSNNETDLLEYCTPNYATNTSKLFSTKEKPDNGPSSGKYSSSEKIFIDVNNLESFSLGPSKNFENKLYSKKDSQNLMEELKSLEEENRSQNSYCSIK